MVANQFTTGRSTNEKGRRNPAALPYHRGQPIRRTAPMTYLPHLFLTVAGGLCLTVFLTAQALPF